jgi:O-antigen/teichoic acid export membrane protein
MFAKNLTYYSVTTYSRILFSFFIVIPILTYYLDAEEFGILALVSAIFIPLSAITNAGTSWILSHGTYKFKNLNLRLLVFNSIVLSLFIRFIIATIFYFFVNWVFELLSSNSGMLSIRHLIIYNLVFVINSFWDVTSPLLVINKKAKVHSVFEFIIWLVNPLVVVLSIIYFDFLVDALFFGLLASAIISAVLSITYLVTRQLIKYNLSIDYIKEIIRVSLYMIPPNIIELLLGSVEKFALVATSSTSTLGIYAHSQNYKGIFISANRVYKNTAIPFMIKEFSDGSDSLSKRLVMNNRLWYSLMAFGSIFLVFFSHSVVSIMTHDKFTSAADLFTIWLAIVVFMHYGSVYSSFLIAHNKIERISIYSSISGLISILVTILFVNLFDIFGAAMGALFYIVSRQLVNRVFAIKYGCIKHGEKDLFAVFIIIALSILMNYFLPEKYFLLYIAILVLCVYKYWNLSQYKQIFIKNKHEK